MYYKIIRDGQVVDAGEMWLRWQHKNRIMLHCDPSEAQFVMAYDGSAIYRVQWLNPAPAEAGTYEVVEAAIIDKQEYLDLRAVLDDGETVPVPEPVVPEPDLPPEPEIREELPETERKMTVEEMRQRIKSQDEQITLLTECILEMSGIIYGE